MNIYITTTGLTPSIILNDLGYRVLNHPIVNYNIGSEFTYDELFNSLDFNNQLDSGYFTASINGYNLISDSLSFQPLSTIDGESISITNKNQLNASIAYVDQANVFGTFSQSFKSGNFSIFNPANTFSYGFTASGITANRNVLLPLLTTDDTFVFQTFSQSMTNKTLLSTNNNVIDATRLQTFTVSTTTPTLNQALIWNGSSWTPGNVSLSGGATGATGATGAAGAPGVGSASTDRQSFTSSTAITTTSATYVDLTGFTLTTKNFGQTGSYLINFSGYCSNSAAGASSYFILNINGVQMLTTERRDTQQAGPQAVLQYNTVAISTLRGLTAGSVIKVQFRNSGTGTVTFYGGELNINGVPVATVI